MSKILKTLHKDMLNNCLIFSLNNDKTRRKLYKQFTIHKKTLLRAGIKCLWLVMQINFLNSASNQD